MFKRKMILTFMFVLCLIGYSQAEVEYSQSDSVLIKKIEADYYDRYIKNDTTRLDKIISHRTASWGIIAGIGFNESIVAEVGYGKAGYGSTWHHWFFSGFFLGSEFLYQNEKFLIAPKISSWLGGGSGGIALGLNLLYYTNLSRYSNIVLRPEIGFCMSKFKLVYGYNISLNKSEFDIVNKHNFSFVLYFETNNKKRTEYTHRDILNSKIEQELKSQ